MKLTFDRLLRWPTCVSAILFTAGLAAAPVASGPRFPYTFERNLGQSHADVRYQARGEGYALFLTEREAVFSLAESRALRMSLAGGRAPSAIHARERQPQRTNYIIGTDASKWNVGVPHFASVEYKSVYPGVDWVFHSAEDRLEYDFVVAPGADPSLIRMRFEGADAVEIGERGALRVDLGGVTVEHRAPVAYQEGKDGRETVQAAYAIEQGDVVFRVGEYDHSRTLVVDPVVVYASFLGGSRTDAVHAVAVDGQGALYLTGETTSVTTPSSGRR
ncbi:MAG: hypothetical protein R2748_22960 [Bryobacterales bacterium]